MKKLGALVLVVISALAYYFFPAQKDSEGNFTAKDLKIRSIAKGNETDYAVRFAIQFKKAGDEPQEVVRVEGVITQFMKSADELVSDWKSVARYSINGSPLEANFVGKQSLTDQQGQHHLVNDFPKDFLRTELMILDRLSIKVPLESTGKVLKEELDDQVPFTAEYSFSKDDNLTVVEKKWFGYKNSSSTVDSKAHTIRYYFDENQRLLAAEGQIKSYFEQGGKSELVIDFSAKSIESRPVADRIKSVSRENFRLADRALVNESDLKNRASSGVSFEEAMKQLDTVTETTDGAKYYEVFRSLTDQVRANPQYSDELSKKILSIKERDPSARRRLAAMFGSLAESRHSEGVDTLANLATDCPDNYCKVQAIMGVNTHSLPSASSTTSMLNIARSTNDKEVAATALIAAGATGRKIESDMPELSKALIQTYADPSKADLKTSTLAAMGNHGSADYWPTLSAGLKSEDSAVRSASVYSLRYLPNEQATPAILNVIEKEPISSVVSEALKASGYRKLSTEQYNQIAIRAADFKNKELAEQAANLMVEAYRTNPSASQVALNTLKEKTKYKDVKLYIEAQLRAPEAPNNK